MTNKEAIEALTSKDVHNSDMMLEALDLAIKALEQQKTGRWINGDSICPCCGEDKFKDLDADIWADWRPKYCPNCGAKMESEG